jgi:predicted ATP-grasp superfamily ATP-dependent carboligase
MYTGSLENHPQLIDRIAATRTLWGNPGHVVSRVRNPFVLADSLARAGLAYPETRPADAAPSPRAGWLRKSFRSAGGNQVQRETALSTKADPRRHFYQRHVRGMPCAALYVLQDREARLLGVTRQLIGLPWVHSRDFRYCGSIGPLTLPPPLVRQFRRIGRLLADEFGLRGVAGVDAVISRDRVWVVEVNPRYPASAEIIERSLGVSVVGLHAAAFGFHPPRSDRLRRTCAAAGKVILFSPTALTATRRLIQGLGWTGNGRDPPTLADVPRPGTPIPQGAPVATLFAEAPSCRAVLFRLRGRIRTAGALIGRVGTG